MNVTISGILSALMLSILYLSTCLASTAPLSSIHKIHTPETDRNQEKPGKDEGKWNKREIKETVPRFEPARWKHNKEGVLPSPLASHFINWLDKDGRHELEVLRRAYYHPRPRPRNASTPVEQRNVGVERNGKSDVTPPAALFKIATSSFSPLAPPPPFSSSSSCSSLTCVWFHSWEFIVITCLTGLWLLVLTFLSCLARTAVGRHLLKVLSCCREKEKPDPDSQVLAKGIGYFDGSPGMRRFVLIEDDDDEEDDDDDESFVAESQCTEDSEGEGRSLGRPGRVWRPPRKGTYILQEPTKDYVVELGTYTLQEDVEEGTEDDKVEYVLEGQTYILQSERVRGGGSSGSRIRDIGDLYEYIEEGEELGEPEISRIEEIEGLYGIIRQERGAESYRRGGDGVIISVTDLERDVGGGMSLNVDECARGGGGRNQLGVDNAMFNQRYRSASVLSSRRAASFPMESYHPVSLFPRKLSLIQEEELH